MNPTTESRIRDLVVTLLAFGALTLWLWLWWRRLFAVSSTDALLLWQLGPGCAQTPASCYNGFFPFGYPLLLGKLFPNDGVYGPTLVNLGACTVVVATFGLVARQLRVGLLATVLATAVVAATPAVAYAATNPGPNALALLLLLLGAGIAFDAQIKALHVRVFVAALVATAAGLFRSELVAVVPIALFASMITGQLSRRAFGWGAFGVLLAVLPQTWVQISAGQLPWTGSHGFSLWVSQQANLNWNRLFEVDFPQSLFAILRNDPASAVSFWATNLLSLLPWVIGASLPAVITPDVHQRGDRAIALTALIWALWAAGDDPEFATLILGPVAALQTARLCIDQRGHISRTIRAGAAVLLAVALMWSGLNLYEQTQEARRIRNHVENLEAMIIDSGATDARRIFVTNPTRYLPTIAPHVPQSPGGWLHLPGAVPSVRPWCAETIECFLRDLIEADVQFVLLDPSAKRFLPAFAETVELDGHGGSPHPCLRSSSSDGVHTVLSVACKIDPATGEFRVR